MDVSKVRGDRWMGVLLAAAGMLMAAAPADARPAGEVQVSAEREIIDPEFSQTRGQIVWSDGAGRMWLADVDRATGLISPPDGRGLLIDPEALSLKDAFITYNGPEWAHAARGDHIVYTKFLPGQPHTETTARLAVARQAEDGTWSYGFLAPDAPRMAPYASDHDRDQSPLMTYVDDRGNHYARGTGPIDSEVLLSDVTRSVVPLRPVRGDRAVLYSKKVDGVRQVHRFDMATQTSEQLTFDPGHKAASWMWRAPEFGFEFVLSTVVGNTVTVYRLLPTAQAGPQWLPVRVIESPPGFKIFSPEPFTYDGKSYFVVAFGTIENDFPSEIWVANVDPENPEMRLVSASTPLRVRADPEVFVTDDGPRFYFNRFVTIGANPPRKCFSVRCSEGVWMADPGLGKAR